MNKSDSERISVKLENDGYQLASKMDEADLVVVNMCSVRQPAVDRIFGLSQKFGQLKTKNYKLKTVLTGCILKKDKIKLRGIFDEIWENPEKRSIPSKFIPISNGCDNFCAYCVVPHTRGKLICRNHKEILNEIENAAKAGIKEIWLLGENVNVYKSEIQNPLDAKQTPRRVASKINSKSKIPAFAKASAGKQNSKQINFAELLKMANDVPGDFKIRFMSPSPADFTDELINVMVKCKKAARYLNLPLQSGDNEILKRMNRPYTIKQYKNLVKKIRAKIPDINLSTDVIVGFPGETKKQFENTVKLFKEIKFNIAYISKYSPRPGTAAFLLKDDVPIKEKKRREKTLMKLLS